MRDTADRQGVHFSLGALCVRNRRSLPVIQKASQSAAFNVDGPSRRIAGAVAFLLRGSLQFDDAEVSQ